MNFAILEKLYIELKSRKVYYWPRSRFWKVRIAVKSFMGSIRRRWLGLRPEETNFARRGFRGATPEMQARLERVGATFVAGYHAALENNSSEAVAQDLAHIEPELRGFAFEGAASSCGSRIGKASSSPSSW